MHPCNSDSDCSFDQLSRHEIIAYRCNRISRRCEGRAVSKPLYDLAVKDLGELRRLPRAPKILRWYLALDDGKRFAVARARFYEDLSARLAGGAIDVAAVAASMRKRSAARTRAALEERLSALTTANREEIDLARAWSREVTGAGPEAEPAESLSFSHYLTSVMGAGAQVHHHRSAKTQTLETVGKPSPLKNLCNENMAAGRAVAIYKGENPDDVTAACVCTYPEYLTGPACKHRTYNYVVDYDKWERDGYPTFLVDPGLDYAAAEKVCAELQVAATAVYEHRTRGFQCMPLPGFIGRSLQFRGPYEPALVMGEHSDPYYDLIGRLTKNKTSSNKGASR